MQYVTQAYTNNHVLFVCSSSLTGHPALTESSGSSEAGVRASASPPSLWVAALRGPELTRRGSSPGPRSMSLTVDHGQARQTGPAFLGPFPDPEASVSLVWVLLIAVGLRPGTRKRWAC